MSINKNNLIKDEYDNAQTKIERYYVPNSGYIKQSTGEGEETDLPLWRDTIILKLEDNV